MKTAKRVFICLLCVSLLLSCSIFSVGAVSWTSTTYNLSQSSFGPYIYTMPQFPASEMNGYTFFTDGLGMSYQTYSFAQNSSNGNMFFTGSKTSSYPVVGLQYMFSSPINLRQNYRYKFSFQLGTDASYSTCPRVRIMFGDWINDTPYATMYYFTFTLNSGDWQSTTCNFEFDGLPNLNEIDTIWILFERSSTTKVPRVWVNNQFVYQYVSSDAYWSGQVEDSVNGNINSSTNQINTNIQASTNEIKAEVQQGADQVAGEIQDQTNQQKGFFQQLGDRISGFFDKLLTGIIDGLKNLFIPGDVTDPDTGQKVSYFTHYFNEWDEWMQDHFGVLYFPFAILFDVLDQILLFRPPANPTITFPGLEIMGQTLLKPINYDFSTFDMPWLNTAHDLYLFAVDAIIGFWLVRLAYKKLTEIMGGGS